MTPRRLVFISHPNVVIDPAVPITRWPLSQQGRARMRQSLAQPWVAAVRAIYSSSEQKALDGAQILAQHLALPITAVKALGENDRSSTGYLTPAEFERMADRFFGEPASSVRGWERACDAQARIVRAVRGIVQSVQGDRSDGAIAIVSHGAVGTLLYCHLAGQPIDRRWDQPGNGGGNCFGFSLAPDSVDGWWRAIDVIASGPG